MLRHLVYKRRITPRQTGVELVLNGLIQGQQTQIAKEIAWFQQLNCAGAFRIPGLRPGSLFR